MSENFYEGELVGVVSKMRPNWNGDYVIWCKLDAGDTIKDKDGFDWNVVSDDSWFLYGLNQANGAPAPMNYSVLRKKFTPGEDFQSLISSLNNDKVTSV